MDPWGGKTAVGVRVEFEDNFTAPCPADTAANSVADKLADSAQYLAILEKRLASVRSKNNLLENLAAYRADCIERLLRDGCSIEPVLPDAEREQLIHEQQ